MQIHSRNVLLVTDNRGEATLIHRHLDSDILGPVSKLVDIHVTDSDERSIANLVLRICYSLLYGEWVVIASENLGSIMTGGSVAASDLLAMIPFGYLEHNWGVNEVDARSRVLVAGGASGLTADAMNGDASHGYKIIRDWLNAESLVPA